MASAREMRLRIQSVKNIGQVTRALQAVSASKVRRAMAANARTKPYAEKAWKVLVHLARQPGGGSLHPLLHERKDIHNILVVMITGDRGLAGASNVMVIRKCLQYFQKFEQPVSYVAVGRKGRDLLWRRRKKIIADFSGLPSPATYMDVSAIGHLIVDEFLKNQYEQIYLAYNDYVNILVQKPIIRKFLPLVVTASTDDEVDVYNVTHTKTSSVFSYEPDQEVLLNEIIPRFIALQVYQSILSAQTSEHAARMMAMKNATDNSVELASALLLEYNKVRQQSITNDLLDIAGAAEATVQAK